MFQKKLCIHIKDVYENNSIPGMKPTSIYIQRLWMKF